MNARFARVARAELRAAVRFHDEQRPGPGAEFADEVERAVGRIEQFPEASQSVSENTRRCRTRRFPDGIFYQIMNDHIRIVAVADLRRAPEHWKDRI